MKRVLCFILMFAMLCSAITIVTFADEVTPNPIWYRTSSGEWTNKHGPGDDSFIQKLGNDIPTDNNSKGWWPAAKQNENDLDDDLKYQFYDSDIIYYVITEG